MIYNKWSQNVICLEQQACIAQDSQTWLQDVG